MAPQKANFKIYQGSTFQETIRWESSEKGYAQVEGVPSRAPLVLTSTGHSIPEGWRCKLGSFTTGMKELNQDNYVLVTSTTVNTLTINSINATTYSNYTSGGVIEYNKPISLVGYTARMQLRDKLTSETTLLELTTENGRIILDTAKSIIALNITAQDTQAILFKSAVYSLELVQGSVVTTLLTGNITCEKEVTR